MKNVYNELPKEKSGAPMQEFSGYVAKAVTSSENAATSAVITLNDSTSTLEVAAVGGPAAIRWIPVANTNPSVITIAGTANFDHIIPTNTMRRFAVPQETMGVTSIVGINKQAGLYNRVAYKSIATASVLTTEY